MLFVCCFRVEYSRFGGINILTDGYNHDVFVLKVSNMQPYNNVECYKDYKGSVQVSISEKVLRGHSNNT
jgi:hypothetical protein